MGTYRTKELAAARENFAQRERTVANELPQELSRLPGRNGCHAVNSFLKGVSPAAQVNGKTNGHPMKAAAVPKARQRAVVTTIGFTDDSHPTILAAARG